ncbi:hypothetical protein CP10743SC13_1947, partial [Chlamydia psittaci 10_743_SC13]
LHSTPLHSTPLHLTPVHSSFFISNSFPATPFLFGHLQSTSSDGLPLSSILFPNPPLLFIPLFPHNLFSSTLL